MGPENARVVTQYKGTDRTVHAPPRRRLGIVWSVPLCIVFAGGGAWAQSGPAINAGGIVSAAGGGSMVAPGSIASVYGSFGVGAGVWASPGTLPTSLAGLSMQFDGGVPARLFYVSDGQVNIQIPWELAGRSQASLTATVGGQTSAPQTVDLVAYAPAIFSTNSQGTGQGAILDGAYNVVDTSHPATPGSTIVLIYATGLGGVTNAPASGAGAPGNPLARTIASLGVKIGGVPAQIVYAGLAPGFAGEYQINAKVPANAATGDAVPVTIAMGGVASNTVAIAVRALAPELSSDRRAGR